MEQLVNAFWRCVYRLGYPCAEVVWRLSRKAGRGACIAVWHDGRLLCIKESYRPDLGLPGGGQHDRESWAETARRELFEEVGIALPAEAFHERGILAYDKHGRSIEDHLFEVKLDVFQPPTIDNREVVWADFLPLDRIRAAPQQRGLRLYLASLDQQARTPVEITCP